MNSLTAAIAARKTHAVITTYADGTSTRHETRSAASAETHAIGERRKVGREVSTRNDDLTWREPVRVVSVAVIPL